VPEPNPPEAERYLAAVVVWRTQPNSRGARLGGPSSATAIILHALLVPLKCRIHMTRAFACWGVIVSAKGHSAHVEAHGLSGPRSLFLTMTCPVESFAFIRAHLTDPVSRMRRSRAHHLKAGSGASALLHLCGIGRVVLSSCFTLVHDKQTKLLSD
jgi:hypothetical protein